MTYIDLINRFWELDEQYQFTPQETRLYLFILRTLNRIGWPQEFERIDAKLAADVGCSVNTLKAARERLVKAGLFSFTSGGKGKGVRTIYQFRCQFRCQKLTANLTPKLTPKEGNEDFRCQNTYQKLTPKVEPKATRIIGTCNKTKIKTKMENNIPPYPPGGEEENSSLLKLKDSFSWTADQWNFIKSIHGISKPDSVIWELIEHVKTNPRLTVMDLEGTLRSYIKSGRLYVVDTTEKDLTVELSSMGITQLGIDEIMDLSAGNHSGLRELIRQVKQSKGKITMPQAFIKSKLRT